MRSVVRRVHSTAAVVLAATVLAAPLLAACGGGTPTPATGTPAPVGTAVAAGTQPPTQGSPAGAPTTAACDLLTDAEIKAASGFTVAAKSSTDPDIDFTATSGCAWTFSGNVWKLILGVTSPGGEVYDRTYQLEGGKAIAGLGDRAFRGSASNVVFVMAGTTLVTLLFVGAGIPDTVDEALMARALARLG